MTDNAEATIRRAERAQAMISDPLFVEAWEAIEAALLAEWRGSAPDCGEDRERIFVALRLLEKVRHVFEGHVMNGKFEAARIAALAKMQPLRSAM